ncbi:MAG: hypothetical protein ACRD8W_24870, partial [Nitrososphaeraceae archaeon]
MFGSVFLLSMILAVVFSSSVYASSNAYDSGYGHGCDDAAISDPDDRYINQPGKGPSFHTGTFMRGYNDGFDACSERNGNDQPLRNSPPESSSTDSGYRVTVSIGDHPFGNQYSYIWIETADGWRDNARLATAGDPSLTFHIPLGYGDTIRVCGSSAIIAPSNCRSFDAGEDFSVRLDVEGLLD